MGDQKITQELERISKTHFINSAHEVCLKELWPLVPQRFGELENIEIISSARVYKLIFKDGRIYKCFLWAPVKPDFLEMVYSAGLPVPKPVAIISRGKGQFFWRFVEWIDGVCDRKALTSRDALRAIAPKYWYEKGKLIAKIHNFKSEGNQKNVILHDVIWTNFAINKDDSVSLIDCRKFGWDYIPERWTLYFVFMNEHLTPEQKEAFTQGYIEEIKGPRNRLDMIKAIKTFMEKLYEKLARE